MTRRDKLDEKIRQGEADISFAEMNYWLNQNGFEQVRSKGSHFIYKCCIPNIPILTIVSPHGSNNKKSIPRYQVKQAINAVDMYKEIGEENE